MKKIERDTMLCWYVYHFNGMTEKQIRSKLKLMNNVPCNRQVAILLYMLLIDGKVYINAQEARFTLITDWKSALYTSAQDVPHAILIERITIIPRGHLSHSRIKRKMKKGETDIVGCLSSARQARPSNYHIFTDVYHTHVALNP